MNQSSSDGWMVLQAAFSMRSDNLNVSPFPHLPRFQFYALKCRSSAYTQPSCPCSLWYRTEQGGFWKKQNLKEINKEVSDTSQQQCQGQGFWCSELQNTAQERGTQQIKHNLPLFHSHLALMIHQYSLHFSLSDFTIRLVWLVFSLSVPFSWQSSTQTMLFQSSASKTEWACRDRHIETGSTYKPYREPLTATAENTILEVQE